MHNPLQADYKWGSVELFKWTDFNGNECEGLLHFPEDYDPFETLPDHRSISTKVQTFLKYRYNTPSPSRSIINPVYCTSNDYIVFIPDIKYRDGFPAKSCYDVVVSGTMALIDTRIADKNRIRFAGAKLGRLPDRASGDSDRPVCVQRARCRCHEHDFGIWRHSL
ncbi:MAG: hypothetical protein ACLR8Y_19605 [Alistipes indistinctus]